MSLRRTFMIALAVVILLGFVVILLWTQWGVMDIDIPKNGAGRRGGLPPPTEARGNSDPGNRRRRRSSDPAPAAGGEGRNRGPAPAEEG